MSHTHYEPKDWSNRWAFRTVIGTFGLFLFGLACSYVFLRFFDHSAFTKTQSSLAKPPQPVVQVNENLDIDALRAKEQSVLTTYAWTNDAKTTARVPIERAMQLIAESKSK